MPSIDLSLRLLALSAIAISLVAADGPRHRNLDTAGARDDSQLISAANCPREFRNRCVCGRLLLDKNANTLGQFVTNCTNSGFKDTSMLKMLPTDTELLIFTGNNLTELPTNLFGNASQKQLSKLREIDLSNNRISSIHGKTFHNVKNVTKLILNNNQLLITGGHFHSRLLTSFDNLEELQLMNSFGDTSRGLNFMEDLITILTDANLTRLKILHLEGNNIRTIPSPEDFCSMRALQYLYLSNNQLVDAKINTTCFNRLKLLDVSDNYIANISNETLAFYDPPTFSPFHVNLTRNPFRCDCNLKPFFNWLKTTKTWIIGNKTFHCTSGYPEDNAGRAFTQLRLTELRCPLVHDEMQGYITASYAVLISLTLALVVLVSALIISNRESLLNGWTHLANSFAAKREYTSLEQESKNRVQQVQQVTNEVDEVAV